MIMLLKRYVSYFGNVCGSYDVAYVARPSATTVVFDKQIQHVSLRAVSCHMQILGPHVSGIPLIEY